MTRTIMAETHFDRVAFGAFGALIEPPARHGERCFFSEWLGGEGPLGAVLHVNALPAAALPLKVSRLERHLHAAQIFVPLDVSRYLVTVAPSLADGVPDLNRVRSFLVPGNRGIVYGRNVWHTPACVLDREGAFAVLMWRGREDDDVFAAVPPFTIVPEACP